MIAIVSGLPRSGTSTAMQMLAAGGLPILTDGRRGPDADNPRGYYEWEPIKRLPQEPDLIAEAEGKAVKVISWLLGTLPAGHDYRVLFMVRPLEEVVASQSVMILNRGAQGPALEPSAMVSALEAHRSQVRAFLGTRPDLPVMNVDYHALLADPGGHASAMARFLEVMLDIQAMADQVDTALYRQRKTAL